MTSRITGTALPADLIRTLIEARRSRGWSQRDLATRTGLPQAHISAIETGKVAPRYGTMLDLVRILGHDLLIVPRALVPAVQALISDGKQTATDDDEGERPLYADRGTPP
jgi:transcriptional regulator with XRE-family HTH domain